MPLFIRDAQTLILNVTDYGADPTGVNNATAAFNSAITALSAAISANGKAALYFPFGTFLLDGLIISNLSNFSLLGPGRLRLNRARVGNALVNTNDVLAIVGCTDFIVDGLEFDGNRHTDIVW